MLKLIPANRSIVSSRKTAIHIQVINSLNQNMTNGFNLCTRYRWRHNRTGLTNECSTLTVLAFSFNRLVNSFNKLEYSLMSSIIASSILHPKSDTYNPKTGRRHHLGSSFAVILPHIRDRARAGSCRNKVSCGVKGIILCVQLYVIIAVRRTFSSRNVAHD